MGDLVVRHAAQEGVGLSYPPQHMGLVCHRRQRNALPAAGQVIGLSGVRFVREVEEQGCRVLGGRWAQAAGGCHPRGAISAAAASGEQRRQAEAQPKACSLRQEAAAVDGAGMAGDFDPLVCHGVLLMR
jgi:hypothetical protein